jgi:hypothetical protein
MKSEVIVGSDQEPVFYKIGSYIFKQRPGSLYRLEEGNPVQKILALLGFTDWTAIGRMTIEQYFDQLDHDGKALQAVQLLLEFHDKTPVHALYRKARMFVLRETKESVLARNRLTYANVAKVLADFFLLNFNSMPRSKDSSSITGSS